jgi:hypothetical protein
VFLLVTLVVFIGVGALALNWTWMSSHQFHLQRACEAAVLAGAAELLDPTAGTTPPLPDTAAQARIAAATERARTFFTPNSNTILQTTGPDSDIVAGWCETPTEPRAIVKRWAGTGPVNSVSVRAVRRRSNNQAIVMWFGNLFGQSDAEPAAAATASMDQRIYGFRPLEYLAIPMVPLMVSTGTLWPSGGVGVAAGMADNYTVAPRTGAVSAGPDQIGEITIYTPLQGGTTPPNQALGTWIRFPNLANDYILLAGQIQLGIDDAELHTMGGQLALAPTNNILNIPAVNAPTVSQADPLVAALLAIRGKKRIWPIGNLVAGVDGPTCQITGFVAGRVVNCSRDNAAIAIVVQGCTLQTATGLLRNNMARNPWIGKIILNQ